MATENGGSGAVKRLLLAADAFLFAAAFSILGSVVLIVVNELTGALNQDVTEATFSALAIQGGSLLLSLAAVGGGAVLAWRLHGRALTAPVVVFMVFGILIGTPAAFALFGGLAFLMSRIPMGDGPPWIAIGVLAAAVIALLAAPMVDAIKDARGPRVHPRLDILRWMALAVVVAVGVIALPLLGAIQGSEMGEAGLFMVPFSLAGALAVLGGDLYRSWIDRRHAKAVRAA